MSENDSVTVNEPAQPSWLARYRKGVVAVIMAAATVATVVISGGWNAVDWVAVITAVLSGFGVVLIPNTRKTA